jgi:flagellar biosynthesis/type III secretory pathway chaperone
MPIGGNRVTFFQQLMDNLRLVQSLYAELSTIGESKKDHIVHNRLNELSQTLAAESKLLKRLAELEQERASLIAGYQQELGVKPEAEATLDDLVRMTVKMQDKREFEAVRDALSAEIRKLRSLNETNQLLVKQALDFVDYTLDLFTAGPENDMVYQAPAQQSASVNRRKGIFDTRA